MGRAKSQSNLAGALFTPVQQRVLGLLFGQPDRRFQSGELIRLVGSGTGAVHRQLGRLATVGIVTVSSTGNQKFYQANAASPVYAELHGLIVKTVGLTEPIRRALAPFSKKIFAAFVFGSVAKGLDRADSDIDLMVLSDSVSHADLYEALGPAELELGRPIKADMMTRAAWQRRRSVRDSYAERIATSPHIMVLGSEGDLS